MELSCTNQGSFKHDLKLNMSTKITNLFRPTSLRKDQFSEMKEPYAPKLFPSIHEGHQYLALMKSSGKYDYLNVRFIFERYGQEVKAMHIECTGEYRIGLKNIKISSVTKSVMKFIIKRYFTNVSVTWPM